MDVQVDIRGFAGRYSWMCRLKFIDAQTDICGFAG